MKPESGLKKLIERLRGRVEAAARATGPAGPFFSIETGLLILSVCYGGIMRLRACLYEKGLRSIKSLPCRVISIGNLVAGGTGKTPMTILVARRLKDTGYRVAVVSRGYRGRMEAGGGIVSDGRTLLVGPDEAGDEPVLMARLLPGVPVVVGRRRYQAGMLAVERFDPDVIVMD
ncbi:MAG: tetraacyldisaccharide 4'-kinase, partial [Desulfosarcina sp.]